MLRRHRRAHASRSRVHDAKRLLACALLTAAAVSLCINRAHAGGDDEISIPIRPFGAPEAARPGLTKDQQWKAFVAGDAVGAEPVAIAVDAAAGKLYWAEQVGRQ